VCIAFESSVINLIVNHFSIIISKFHFRTVSDVCTSRLKIPFEELCRFHSYKSIFSLSALLWQNKSQSLSLTFFQGCHIFASKGETILSEVLTMLIRLSLVNKYMARMKRLARDKHFSILS